MNNILDFCGYTLFSFLEGGAFFVLIFCAFRIELMEYIREIVLTNILVSCVSFLVRENEVISNFFPLVNVILVIFVLIVLFKISTLYAVFVTAFGFISCFLIQGTIINLADVIFSLHVKEIQEVDYIRYIFQTISSGAIMLIGYTFKKKRLWFTMLPYDFKLSFKITKKNTSVLIIVLLAILTIGMILDMKLLSGLFPLLILLAAMFHLGIKRERVGGFD